MGIQIIVMFDWAALFSFALAGASQELITHECRLLDTVRKAKKASCITCEEHDSRKTNCITREKASCTTRESTNLLVASACTIASGMSTTSACSFLNSPPTGVDS